MSGCIDSKYIILIWHVSPNTVRIVVRYQPEFQKANYEKLRNQSLNISRLKSRKE